MLVHHTPVHASRVASTPALVMVFVRAMQTNVSRVDLTLLPCNILNRNSESLKRFWGVHKHAVGDLSGHWSTVSTRLHRPFGHGAGTAKGMSTRQCVELLCKSIL